MIVYMSIAAEGGLGSLVLRVSEAEVGGSE